MSIQSGDVLTFTLEKFPYPYGRWETALNLGFHDVPIGVENVVVLLNESTVRKILDVSIL